jgi:hypothetical protein
MPRELRFGLLLVFLLGFNACASSQRVAPVWNASMGDWFSNDSVDPYQPPRGYWTDQDEDVLLRRMGYADSVVVGTLRVVSQYGRGEVASELTLAFHADELLFGSLERELDEAGELLLQPEPSSPEFRLALRIQRNLPGTRYLLFLKRQPQGKAERLRWALYRPTQQLLQEIRSRYTALRRHHDGRLPTAGDGA